MDDTLTQPAAPPEGASGFLRRPTPDHLLLVMDLAATLFRGLDGAMAAIEGRLDAFGILVLSFTAALGGGVFRDLLMGAVPPAAVRNVRYPITAFAGALIAFFLWQSVHALPPMALTSFAAAGLALFCVVGAAKALDYGIPPLMAVLMGTITGVGGGVIRDLFLARVPLVLRAEVLAVAAMAGAAVMVIATLCRVSRRNAMFAGALVCFILRMLAVSQHWSLPHAVSQ